MIQVSNYHYRHYIIIFLNFLKNKPPNFILFFNNKVGEYEVVGLLNLLGKEMSMFVSRIYRKHSLRQICLYIVYCL